MNKVINFLDTILKRNTKIVLALSGGPDSILLFNLLLSLKDKYNLTIICAHVNHNVRKESDDEELFVKKITEDNNCIFETKKLNFKNLKSFEEKARDLRYTFFNEIINKYQADFLMTAHHADDLIETILMRLVRGSNIKGYIGFKKISDLENYKLVRPLIYVTKEEIINYCQKNNLKYCLDKTNDDLIHTRNRFRKNVLPNLKIENKSVHKKFLKYSEDMEEIDDYLEKNTQNSLTKVLDFDKVNLHEFNKLDLVIKKRIIEKILKQEYQNNINYLNSTHLDLILKICASNKPNCTLNLPLKRKVIKEYNHLYITNFKKNAKLREYILNDYVKINNEEEFIKLENYDGENSNYIIRLNSKEIAFPLKLRTRKTKDFMSVKNLKGTKKVKDIFINEKVPQTIRDNLYLLVDNNDNILWMPGLKKSKFDKNKNEFYDIIYKYVKKEKKYEKK